MARRPPFPPDPPDDEMDAKSSYEEDGLMDSVDEDGVSIEQQPNGEIIVNFDKSDGVPNRYRMDRAGDDEENKPFGRNLVYDIGDSELVALASSLIRSIEEDFIEPGSVEQASEPRHQVDGRNG